jgi:hypothetical protein
MLSLISGSAKYSLLTLFLWAVTLQTVWAQSGVESPAVGSVKLNNPLKVGTIEGLLVAILNVVIVIAVPIIVFFIIYAGFLYVTAKGNASQVEQATRALLYAVIGGVVIIGAVAIAGIVRNIVSSF